MSAHDDTAEQIEAVPWLHGIFFRYHCFPRHIRAKGLGFYFSTKGTLGSIARHDDSWSDGTLAIRATGVGTNDVQLERVTHQYS